MIKIITPIGKLNRNIHLQLSISVIKPPITGPNAIEDQPIVAVKANATNFSYTGNTSPAPQMPVSGVLGIKVTANGTGGSIANPFSNSAYATLSGSDQDLITTADRGGNQTFSVKYKATPGFAYPAGTYSVDVVYTATQE